MCVVNFNFQWDIILKTVRKRSLYVISNHKRKFFTIPSDYIISLNRTLYIKSCIQNMSDQLSLSYWRTILSGSKIFQLQKCKQMVHYNVLSCNVLCLQLFFFSFAFDFGLKINIRYACRILLKIRYI